MTLVYTAGIATILFLAYTHRIPTEIAAIPLYDKLGHFILYAIWAYLSHRALKRRRKFGIPIAPTIITAITITEEYLQCLSPYRTFSLLDLAASLSGIWLMHRFGFH